MSEIRTFRTDGQGFWAATGRELTPDELDYLFRRLQAARKPSKPIPGREMPIVHIDRRGRLLWPDGRKVSGDEFLELQAINHLTLPWNPPRKTLADRIREFILGAKNGH